MIGSGRVQVDEIVLGGYRAIATVMLLFATFNISFSFNFLSYEQSALAFLIHIFKAFQIYRQNRWGPGFKIVRNPVYTSRYSMFILTLESKLFVPL